MKTSTTAAKKPAAPKLPAKISKAKAVTMMVAGELSHSTAIKRDLITHKSDEDHPCSAAWDIFEQVRDEVEEANEELEPGEKKQKATRKASINAAVEAGIAFYTARTQYQLWKAAGDAPKKKAVKK